MKIPTRALALRLAMATLAMRLLLHPTGGHAGGHEGDEGAKWVDFTPAEDPFARDAALDLRSLNEPVAGAGGFIGVEADRFVREDTGRPIRFWGVNGPPGGLRGEGLKRAARMLAKRGVNLVRIHRPVFGEGGQLEPERVLEVIEVVEAMKAEGIYTWLSVYFPLWLTPAPGTPWLEGYDGRTHPFAALMFNPAFEAQYRRWWSALLTTPSPATGRTLAEEPAVAVAEIQNEDSFLFATFDPDAMPEAQRAILERRFGAWLADRYGSVDAALDRWTAEAGGFAPAVVGGMRSVPGAWRRGWRHLRAWWRGVALPGDAPDQGRAALSPPWRIAANRAPRDQDTVRFLVQVQTTFYERSKEFLRSKGFRGAITASNWTTASPAILGPLEKMSYLGGDFLDRHAYFDCDRKGDRATYQLREGQTYRDRSALRLEDENGRPRAATSPAGSPTYDGKPSTVSEVSWTRPNRHRSEAPLFLAAYGAQQGTAAVVHFAMDSDRWTVQPRPFAQPWTLLSPAMMGQFPAAAVLYRQGLVATGSVVGRVDLDRSALLRLEGAPVLADDAPDPLRAAVGGAREHAATVPGSPGPLAFLMGRVDVRFTDGPGHVELASVGRAAATDSDVVASTSGDLRLDLARGVLLIDAPTAQGASGDLAAAGPVGTRDLRIRSRLPVGHVIAVPLDGRPIAESGRILVQVMSEERPTGFRSESVGGGRRRIVSLGGDPWQIRSLEGQVSLLRPDAGRLQVQVLDANGYVLETFTGADRMDFREAGVYYLITPRPPASAAGRGSRTGGLRRGPVPYPPHMPGKTVPARSPES